MNKGMLASIVQLLSPSQRREGFKIIIALCLSSILDFFSLAFFLPLILLVVNPAYVFQNKYLAEIYHLCRFTSHSQFAIVITFSVIIFLFIKTQINRWIIHLKAIYAYSVANELAAGKMDEYSHGDYSQFISTDFSKQSNRITQLPLTFANNIIIPAGTLLSESIVSFLLLSGIILFDSRAFLFLSALFVPLVAISILKRKQLKKISKKIKTTYPLLLKYTMQSVEGWVEIKSMHKHVFFKNKFNTKYSELTDTFTKAHLINTSPARTTELIAAISVGLLFIYSLWSEHGYQQTLVLLGIYAGVSFRIIPSLNRIFSALLQMKSHEYVVEELGLPKQRQSEPKQSKDALCFEQSIHLSHISFGYPAQPLLLNSISLTIHKGERVVISGRSGSGKTTLLLILLRFIKETTGKILVDQTPLCDVHTRSWQQLIGYVPQSPYILDGSIAENIAFGIPCNTIDLEKVKLAAQQAELSHWIETLPEDIHTLLGERGARISGGQRQRIALARAFYHDAEILLLDEATNQLDSETEDEIIHTIIQNLKIQKTIIVVSHNEKLLKQFDTIYELKEGQLKKQYSKVLI